VGYGRTGTESLQKALDILGYKTFHTKTMMLLERPTLLGLWHSSLFSNGRPPLDLCPLDLEQFLQGYTAATGMMFSVCFQKVLDTFPDAHFILTRHNSPEDWFQSWSTLINSMSLLPRYAAWLPRVSKIDDYNRWLLAWIHRLGGNSFDASYFADQHPLKQRAVLAQRSYTHHIEHVRQTVPSDRLFELELGSGWEPLCAYLNVSVPVGIPYPCVNKSSTVVWTCRSVVLVSNLLLIVALYGLTRFIAKLARIITKTPPIVSVKDGDGNETDTHMDEDNEDGDDYMPTVRIIIGKNSSESTEKDKYLLTMPMMQQLAKKALPPMVALRCWQQCYRLSRDGDDFGTFLNATKNEKQTLLVVKTTKGKIFGAFADSLWDSSARENYSISTGSGFYGSTQACLFTFEEFNTKKDRTPVSAAAEESMNTAKELKLAVSHDKSQQLQVFKWTGRNRFIQLFDIHKSRVAFGGGESDQKRSTAFGLCIEDNFSRGTTAPNETYGNEYPLTGNEQRFAVMDIEIWSFPHGTLG